MAKVKIAPQATGAGTTTVQAGTSASDFTITLPDVTGTAVVSSAVSASTTNTVTNKLAINIGGTTYYLLASTSGA